MLRGEVICSYLQTWPLRVTNRSERLRTTIITVRSTEERGDFGYFSVLHQTTNYITMKSTCLLILASLVVCNLTLSGGQGIPADDETDGRTIDDIILQRAESLLLRSILKKMQEEDDRNEGSSSQTEWVTKRQHPGKRYSEGLEKRQHPGRREDDEDGQYLDVEKRQHPGKREDEMHSFMELQKRQHPGKRTTMGHISENPVMLLSELSKRQHPGKRYLVLHSKRQHPGKRHLEDEDFDEDWDADADADDDLAELEKRQHPGKRFLDNPSPDLGTNSPCDVLDPTSCSKSLLLDFLDNINKSHAEEKRQHPGKRFAPEEDLVEGE
ncbi:pro-thyrotropin-releasing hormone [Epinephelus fuscoguttatus]|uniref:pro-thyrotropin-releasing hormone n=1 Tax=Epinephelus fuscoguttatus TaxID=293821 RepID=UPI0020D11915|nr:pro-thyrotropin-releasing hormone [Epinephelus fuscoguttatus]